MNLKLPFGHVRDGGIPSRRKSASRWSIRRLREERATKKRWGPKQTWNGNNATDIEIKNVADDHWYVTAWSLCRCGKEYKFWHSFPLDHTEEHIHRFISLFGGLCKGCQAWVAEQADYCQEMECILPNHHKGRCHLISEDPAHIEAIEKVRKTLHD